MVCWTMQYIPQWIFMDFQGTLFSEKPTYNYLQMLIITARLYHLQLAPVKGIRPNLLDKSGLKIPNPIPMA